MSTSAERAARPVLRAPARAEAGFTLLEVLVTLAIVTLAIMPMLAVRDAAWNIAYRSGHMLRAADYAERILAEHMTDPDDVKEQQGVIEEDPAFEYELTIETYDLSTGRVEEAGDESFSASSKFSQVPAAGAPDAGLSEDEEAEDSPHRERRFKLHVMYPGLDDDNKEEYVLEGYLPMVKEHKDLANQPAK